MKVLHEDVQFYIYVQFMFFQSPIFRLGRPAFLRVNSGYTYNTPLVLYVYIGEFINCTSSFCAVSFLV